MDADLQDSPEAIPQLLSRIQCEDRPAVVFAGRRGCYEPWPRYLSGLFFKWTLSRLCGTPPDAGSFCIMAQEMARRVLAMSCREPYLLAMMGATRLPMVAVPVERKMRPVGESAYSCRMRLKLAWAGLPTALRGRAVALGPYVAPPLPPHDPIGRRFAQTGPAEGARWPVA